MARSTIYTNSLFAIWQVAYFHLASFQLKEGTEWGFLEYHVLGRT